MNSKEHTLYYKTAVYIHVCRQGVSLSPRLNGKLNVNTTFFPFSGKIFSLFSKVPPGKYRNNFVFTVAEKNLKKMF